MDIIKGLQPACSLAPAGSVHAPLVPHYKLSRSSTGAAALEAGKRRTCVVDEVRVTRVGDDDGNEVGLGHIELAQLEEGGALLPVVVAQEALQVLQACCAPRKGMPRAKSQSVSGRGASTRQITPAAPGAPCWQLACPFLISSIPITLRLCGLRSRGADSESGQSSADRTQAVVCCDVRVGAVLHLLHAP